MWHKSEALATAIETANWKSADALTKEAVADGADVRALISEIVEPVATRALRAQDSQEYFVAEILLLSRGVKLALDNLRLALERDHLEPVGRVAFGTVQGDLHEVGKRLVTWLMEANGFDVVDLGVDVPPSSFVREVREHPGTIVALSSLLTSTSHQMRRVMQELSNAGVRNKTRVLIGGASILPGFAKEIGADGYGANAVEAAAEARRLMESVRAEAQ